MAPLLQAVHQQCCRLATSCGEHSLALRVGACGGAGCRLGAVAVLMDADCVEDYKGGVFTGGCHKAPAMLLEPWLQ